MGRPSIARGVSPWKEEGRRNFHKPQRGGSDMTNDNTTAAPLGLTGVAGSPISGAHAPGYWRPPRWGWERRIDTTEIKTSIARPRPSVLRLGLD
jgi:hypothetical protein